MTKTDFDQFKCLTECNVVFLGSERTINSFKIWYEKYISDNNSPNSSSWYLSRVSPTEWYDFVKPKTEDFAIIVFPDYPFIKELEDSHLINDYIKMS